MERPTRDFALQLISSKDKMESELVELLDVLKSNNTDMTQPLVDAEGFPRADVDVYQVRTIRQKVICLRNDLKNLTKQIESVLHNLHAQQREGAGMEENIKTPFLNEYDEYTVPFAKIGAVTEGSPAEKAGLKTDDLVLGFGSLRASNFSSLKDVAQIVQHRLECEIPLCIRRSGALIQITLIPKPWSGKGFLGCIVLPFDTIFIHYGRHSKIEQIIVLPCPFNLIGLCEQDFLTVSHNVCCIGVDLFTKKTYL